MKKPTPPPAPTLVEAKTRLLEGWSALAWRPAGSRSLSEHWRRLGEPAPKSRAPRPVLPPRPLRADTEPRAKP